MLGPWQGLDIEAGSPRDVMQDGTDIGNSYLWYGGWSFAPDFGAYGAIVIYAGGHAGNVSPQVFVFDVETLSFRRVADEPPRPWLWSTGSEVELDTGEPSAPYAASWVNAGWRYRYSSPDLSKWPQDWHRSAVTYGELAPGHPMVGHAYSAAVCLPAGVLGGGAKGSLVMPLHTSQHFSSGIYSYYGHQLDLATGVWRRMADEIGPYTYYAQQHYNQGLPYRDDYDFRWMGSNQPSCSTAEYANGRIYLRCRFDATNRAVAAMDVSGPGGTERWSVIPGSGYVDYGGQGSSCLVSDSTWWVDYVAGTGQLLVADIGHGPTGDHQWVAVTLAGEALPVLVPGAVPAMVYIESQRRIVMFTNDGSWPANTVVDIAVPSTIGGTWVVTRSLVSGVQLRSAQTPTETYRKLLVCEKAGVLLWYPSWPGPVQAIKPAWWAAGAPPPPPDTLAPTVLIVRPADGSSHGNRYVTISVNATDDVGVVRIEVFVDSTLIGSAASAPYTIRWDTRGYARGKHVVTARATDAASNVGSRSISVTLR